MLLKRIVHRDENRITINLPFEDKYNRRIRAIKGRQWSSTLKVWHVPDNSESISLLKKMFPEFMDINMKEEVIISKPDISIKHNKKDALLYISTAYRYKDIIKRAKEVRWDSSNKLFVVTATKSNIDNLLLDIKKENISYQYEETDFSIIKRKIKSPRELLPPIPSDKVLELEKLEKWMIQKRYASSTISDYKSCLNTFFRYFSDKAISEIGVKEIEEFNYKFIIANQYSEKTQNQYISSIKTFYVKMHNINHEIDNIERPITGRKLPRIIAKEDIGKILRGIINRKHKVVLSLIYSLGLRKSELINLKLADINYTRHTVDIINSKGKRDRILPLPRSIVSLLMEYLDYYNPTIYFIEGQKKGRKYSATSVSNIFEKNVERVLKNHNFTPNSLRHSYATHLLDSGVDLRHIQELLGHKSSKTTEIYTHVSMKSLKGIKNPFDDFDI